MLTTRVRTAALLATVSAMIITGTVAAGASQTAPTHPVRQSVLNPGDSGLSGAAIDGKRGLLYISSYDSDRVLLYTTGKKRLGRTRQFVFPQQQDAQLGAVEVDQATGLAYVIAGASQGVDGGSPSEVIVLRRTSVVAQIKIGFTLYASSGLAVDQHSGDVYLTEGKKLAVIHGQHVVKTLTLRQPNSVVLTDDSNGYAYALDSPQSDFTRRGTVTVLHGSSVVKTIAVPQDYPTSGAVDPRTHDVFVGDSNTPTVTVLRRSNVVTRKITVPKNQSVNAVAVNPLTGLAALATTGGVVFVDAKHVVSSHKLDNPPSAIAVDPRTDIFTASSDHSTDTQSYGIVNVFRGTRHVEQLRSDLSDLAFSVDPRRDLIVGLDYFNGLLFLQA